MGRITREGYGYGMTQSEAMRDFANRLNEEYGSGMYQGGGNDIREYLEIKCITKPKKGTPAKRTKISKNEKDNFKLVNGFEITNLTQEDLCIELLSGRNASKIITKYALTQTDAKKIAKELSLKHNSKFYIIPSKLLKHERTGKLQKADVMFTVEPFGGTKDTYGKWYFRAECGY